MQNNKDELLILTELNLDLERLQTAAKNQDLYNSDIEDEFYYLKSKYQKHGFPFECKLSDLLTEGNDYEYSSSYYEESSSYE